MLIGIATSYLGYNINPLNLTNCVIMAVAMVPFHNHCHSYMLAAGTHG